MKTVRKEAHAVRPARHARVAAARRARARGPFVGHVHTPVQLATPSPVAARAGERVAEIAARQRFLLPVVAVLNGKPLLRAAWDHALKARDRLVFVTLPAGSRGGVKDIFRTVLQIAMVLSATYFLGPGGLGLTGWELGAAVAATQIASSYLLNAILPPVGPSLGGLSSGEAGSPTYSLQAQGNQARLGQPIPKLYGRHVLTPDFAAQPYTEYAGNDLYLYQLFSLGLGEYDVERILIADTELWNATFGFTGNFSDVDFEIVAPGNPVSLFPANVITSVEVSGITLDGPNKGGDWSGPYVANTAGTNANFLALDFIWGSGAAKISDDGSLGSVLTTLRAEARQIDNAGAPLGGFFLLAEETFSFATRTQQRISRRFSVPAGRYEVRVRRINDSATDTRTFDEVSWAALRAYIVSANTFPKITTLAMRMRATNQLSGQASRRVRTVQTSKLPTWNGATWSPPVPTRQISAIAADVLRNAVYGAGTEDARIDLATLMSLQATWDLRGDVFDGVFDQRMSIWDALYAVLRAGRTQPVMVGNVVTFVRDEKRTVPRALFNPRNIVRNSFSADYILLDPDTPDCVDVEYMDAETWTMKTVRAALPGSTAQTPAKISFFGCTAYTRAWREGMYQCAANKYRRILPLLSTEMEGRMVRRGDSVLVAHPLPSWGRTCDVRAYGAARRALTLSEPASLAGDGATNFMSLRRPDGSAWGPVIVSAGAVAEEVVMDAADLAALIADPTQGDPAGFIVADDGQSEPTSAVLGAGSDFLRECLVVTARPETGSRIQFALVVDDERVYTADGGEPPAEPSAPALPPTPAKPTTPVLAAAVQGEALRPVIVASVTAVPGAESYIWQVSYDFVRWQTVQAGPAREWTGEVAPGPVWLRVTAMGALASDPADRFWDLTVSQAQPPAPGGLFSTAFAQHAWVDFTLAESETLAGVIVKASPAAGFDPETQGVVQYDGPPTTRVLVDLGASGTVYVRLAAYNIYGKVGLNWSGEIKIVSRGISSGALSPELKSAFDNAEVLPDGVVYRLDAGGNIAGFGVIHDGALNEIAAAFLVDTFTIRLPGGTTAPLFEVTADGVKISELFATSLTAETLKAVWATVDELRAGRIRSLDDSIDFNLTDGYFLMKKVLP